MRRFLLSGLLLVATACEQETPSTDAVTNANVPATVAARYAPGQHDTYRFSWTNRSRGKGPAILGDAVPVEGGLHLEGLLSARWYDTPDGTPAVGVTIVELDTANVTVMGQNIAGRLEPLTSLEVVATLDAQGAVTAVHVPADATPLARDLLGSLVGRLDFRAPDGTSTSAVIPTSQGVAEATYRRQGNAIRRDLSRSIRVDSDVAMATPVVDGTADLQLDEQGALKTLSAHDTLVVAHAEEPLLEAETQLELQRVASTRTEPAAAPDLSGWDSLDPLAPPDVSEAARVMAQRYADGLTGFDVSVAVRSVGNGLPPARGFMVRAVGRLRGWPETATELVDVFDAFEATSSRRLVFDMLASAGTPEAQQVMRELQARPDVQAHDAFVEWLQRWSFVERPQTESAEFLVRLHADAVERDAHRTRAAVLYPMGAVARRIEPADPLSAAALLEAVRDALEPDADRRQITAALSGLGNGAAPADLDALLSYTDHDDPQIRAAAAEGLRFLDAAGAEDRLLALLADDDRFVAERALSALGYIERSEVPTRLANAALAEQINPGIATGVASEILAAELDEELTRSVVQSLGNQATDPRQQTILLGWLGEVAGGAWARG